MVKKRHSRRKIFRGGNCPSCSGRVTLWNRGDEVFRVTARKDEWGEINRYG